jgi:hypothetical protein
VAARTLALGLGGSDSRSCRSISSNGRRCRPSVSKGNVPVSNTNRITPSENTSVRVSTSATVGSACSGLMYPGVPTTTPARVNSVCSAPGSGEIAFAMPKSMIRACGLPSTSDTRTFEGFKSR